MQDDGPGEFRLGRVIRRVPLAKRRAIRHSSAPSWRAKSAVATSALFASNGRFTRAAGLILASDQGRLRGLLGSRLWADPTSAPAMPVNNCQGFRKPAPVAESVARRTEPAG